MIPYLSTTMQVDTSNNRDIATAFGNKHNLQNNIIKKKFEIFWNLMINIIAEISILTVS